MNNKQSKFKRIAAWVGIVLLVGIYLAALISALLNTPASHAIFISAIYSSVVVPVFIYIMIMIYNYTHKDNGIDARDVKQMLKEAETENNKHENDADNK